MAKQTPGPGFESKRNLATVLIDPFRQIKFGLYVLVLSVIFIVAAGGLFIKSFVEQYQHVMGLFNVVDPDLRWDFVVNDVFYTNAIRLVIFFSLFLLILFVVVFKLTHRYYGPLVSIERFLGEITAGNYKARIFIRSQDELQDLVRRLNTLAETLEKRHKD